MRRNGLTKYDAPLKYNTSGVTMPSLKDKQQERKEDFLHETATWILTPCSIVNGSVVTTMPTTLI